MNWPSFLVRVQLMLTKLLVLAMMERSRQRLKNGNSSPLFYSGQFQNWIRSQSSADQSILTVQKGTCGFITYHRWGFLIELNVQSGWSNKQNRWTRIRDDSKDDRWNSRGKVLLRCLLRQLFEFLTLFTLDGLQHLLHSWHVDIELFNRKRSYSVDWVLSHWSYLTEIQTCLNGNGH